MKKRLIPLLATVLLTVLWSANICTAETNEDLAKKTQNPVADLISVPFQNNTNFGLGPHNRAQNILNIQPVVPLNLTDDWNLITRTIVPILRQPDLAKTTGSTSGLGDINLSLFASPANSGPVIWGLGPVLQFPPLPMKCWGQENGVPGPQGSPSPCRVHGWLGLLHNKRGPTRAMMTETR